MKRKNLFFIVPLIFLFSCQSNKERLIGHWHNLDYNSTSKFHTVDFIDSVTIVNIMDISMACEGKYELEDDTIFYSICGQPGFVSCGFNGDTLLLDKERFVKVLENSKACTDVFLNTLKLEVQLSEEDNPTPINLVPDINGNLTFGRLKKQDITKDDSFYLQINHHVTKISEVKVYMEAMEEVYEDENIKKSVMLTIDKNTPKWMVDSAKSMIKRYPIINKIYKTCIDRKTGGIGLVKMED